MKHRAFDVLLGMATLCLTCLFFIPLSIFLFNQNEFYSHRGEVIRLLLLISAVVGLLSGTLLAATGGRLRRYVVSAIAFACLATWVQGYLFNWNYGPFDGSSIDFRLFEPRGADILVWAVLGAAVFIAGVLKQVSFRTLFLVLIFIQAGNLVIALNSTASSDPSEIHDERAATISKMNQFAFSSDTNIIMLVLDGFQTDAFNEHLESHPAFKANLPGFTYYPDALAVSYYSSRSIPVVFSGQVYDMTTSFSEYLQDAYAHYSMPALLKQAGYYVGVYNYFSLAQSCFHPNLLQGIADNYSEEEEAPAPYYGHEIRRILATALFRVLPHAAKSAVYTRWLLEAPLEQDRDLFIHGLQTYGRVGSAQPRFNYYHLQGLHQPHVIDGEVLDWQDRDSIRRMTGLLCGVMDQFVKRLQSLGVYNDAAVFIIADHGLIWESDQVHYGRFGEPSGPSPASVGVFAKKPRALPLVLFKPPGAGGDLVVSDKPVSLKDITPTVLDVAGVDIEGRYEGVSLLRLGEGPRVRRFFSSEYQKRGGGPIYEYAITGFSWHDDAWNYTGNVYERNRVRRMPFDNYVPGTEISFGWSGRGFQYLDRHWEPDMDGHRAVAKTASLSLPMETLGAAATLRVSVSAEDDAGQTLHLYVNGEKTGPHALSGRTEITVPVSLEGLSFSGRRAAPARIRQPWLAPAPEVADTQLEVRFELEQAPADARLPGLKLHALVLEDG